MPEEVSRPLPPLTPYNPLATYEVGGLKRFTNAAVQSAVDSALAEMKPEDNVVVVAHQVYNQDGTAIENVTKVSAVVRLPHGLSILAGGYKDWTKGSLGAEGKIIWKPKF
jgi:hypothetical protein